MSMATASMPSRWGGVSGRPEAVQTFLLAVVGTGRALGLLQISHDRQVAMAFGDGNDFSSTPRPAHLSCLARAAPGDRPPLDPPDRSSQPILQTRRDTAATDALLRPVDDQTFEQHRKLRPRLRPRDSKLHDPVLRARDPRHVRLNPRLKLARVQMPPTLVPGDRRLRPSDDTPGTPPRRLPAAQSRDVDRLLLRLEPRHAPLPTARSSQESSRTAPGLASAALCARPNPIKTSLVNPHDFRKNLKCRSSRGDRPRRSCQSAASASDARHRRYTVRRPEGSLP